MELYVCILRLFLFASVLSECCAFVLPSFLSPSPFALWWSAHVVCLYYCLPLSLSVHGVPYYYWNCISHSHCLLRLALFPVWQVIVGWHALGVWSILCTCQSWWMPPPHTLLQLTVTQVLLSTDNFVMGDCEELKIVTFNTNGLGEFKKRKDVFDFLRKQSANIFLLQETHWKTGAENVIRSQWGFECIFCGARLYK